MTKYVLAVVTALLSTNVSAAEITKYVGTERNLDTEINSVYAGASVNAGALTIGTEITSTATVEDNSKFNFSAMEIDVDYEVTPHVVLYMDNDYDADFKHEDTVVGAKFKF